MSLSKNSNRRSDDTPITQTLQKPKVENVLKNEFLKSTNTNNPKRHATQSTIDTPINTDDEIFYVKHHENDDDKLVLVITDSDDENNIPNTR